MIIFQSEYPETNIRLNNAIVDQTSTRSITFDLNAYDNCEIEQAINAHYAMGSQTIIENGMAYIVVPISKIKMENTITIKYEIKAAGHV